MDFVYTVVGIRKSSFKDKTTGELVEFCRVYCTFDEGEDTEGMAVEIFKVRPGIVDAAGVEVGCVVEPRYNKYGRVADIVVVER